MVNIMNVHYTVAVPYSVYRVSYENIDCIMKIANGNRA